MRKQHLEKERSFHGHGWALLERKIPICELLAFKGVGDIELK
jgi:hypothetical protein